MQDPISETGTRGKVRVHLIQVIFLWILILCSLCLQVAMRAVLYYMRNDRSQNHSLYKRTARSMAVNDTG